MDHPEVEPRDIDARDLWRELNDHPIGTIDDLRGNYRPEDLPSRKLCKILFAGTTTNFSIFRIRSRRDPAEYRTSFRVSTYPYWIRVRAIDTLAWYLIQPNLRFTANDLIQHLTEDEHFLDAMLEANRYLGNQQFPLCLVTHEGRRAEVEVLVEDELMTYQMTEGPPYESHDLLTTITSFRDAPVVPYLAQTLIDHPEDIELTIRPFGLVQGENILCHIRHEGRDGALKAVRDNDRMFYGVDDSYASRTLRETLLLFRDYPRFPKRIDIRDFVLSIAPEDEQQNDLYTQPFYFEGVLYQVRRENDVYQIGNNGTVFHDFDCVDRLHQLEVMQKCARESGLINRPLQIRPRVPPYWTAPHHFELDEVTEIKAEPPGGFAFSFVEIEAIKSFFNLDRPPPTLSSMGDGTYLITCWYWEDGSHYVKIMLDGVVVNPDGTGDGEAVCKELLWKTDLDHFENDYEAFARMGDDRSLDYLLVLHSDWAYMEL